MAMSIVSSDESEGEVSEVETAKGSDVVPVPTEEEQLQPKKTKPAASWVLSSFMREEQFKAEMKGSKLLASSILVDWLYRAYNSCI